MYIIAACEYHCVDFNYLFKDITPMQSYYDIWASLFHPISNEDEWPLYDGLTILPYKSMKRIGNGCPKSTHMHN